jgi:hypothetical protein
MTERAGPPPPGSPEARAIIARFIATRCAYVYRGRDGERCCNLGVIARDGRRWCAEHVPPTRSGSGDAVDAAGGSSSSSGPESAGGGGAPCARHCA